MKAFISFVFLFLVTFFFSLFLTETSFAQINSNWQAINLKATTGAVVRVEYQMNPLCQPFEQNGRRDFLVRMATAWISVYGISPKSQVEVEIQSYKQDMIPRGSGQNPILRTYEHYDRKIRLQSGVFSRHAGSLGLVATRVTSGSARVEDRISQRIQVRINGVPLIDPISRTDSFGISMYDRIPCL